MSSNGGGGAGGGGGATDGGGGSSSVSANGNGKLKLIFKRKKSTASNGTTSSLTITLPPPKPPSVSRSVMLSPDGKDDIDIFTMDDDDDDDDDVKPTPPPPPPPPKPTTTKQSQQPLKLTFKPKKPPAPTPAPPAAAAAKPATTKRTGHSTVLKARSVHCVDLKQPMVKHLALQALNQLYFSEEITAFLWPITDNVAPGYSKKVTTPMDFLTIRQKITGGKYTLMEEFADDVWLVWRNCILFNGRTSKLSKTARHYANMFERVYDAMIVRPLATATETPVVKKPDDYAAHTQPLDVFGAIKCLDRMMKVPGVLDFTVPIAFDDYTRYVKKPMNLTVVRQNIHGDVYTTNADFAADVQLVWQNCLTYYKNSKSADAKALSSYYIDVALVMASLFETVYLDFLQSLDEKAAAAAAVGKPPVVPPPPAAAATGAASSSSLTTTATAVKTEAKSAAASSPSKKKQRFKSSKSAAASTTAATTAAALSSGPNSAGLSSHQQKLQMLATMDTSTHPMADCALFQTEALKILAAIMKKPESQPFSFPITPQVLADYATVIANPIDLATIKARTERHEYKSNREWARDMELVWSNCAQYHQPHAAAGAEPSQRFLALAQQCRELFRPKYARLLVKLSELTDKHYLDAVKQARAAIERLLQVPRNRPTSVVSYASYYRSLDGCETWIDYDKVVTERMDLETIERRISSGYYHTPGQLHGDIGCSSSTTTTGGGGESSSGTTAAVTATATANNNNECYWAFDFGKFSRDLHLMLDNSIKYWKDRDLDFYNMGMYLKRELIMVLEEMEYALRKLLYPVFGKDKRTIEQEAMRTLQDRRLRKAKNVAVDLSQECPAFHLPFDPRVNHAYANYYSIVKRPICIEYIIRKLDIRGYTKGDEVLSNLNLLVGNAELFFGERGINDRLAIEDVRRASAAYQRLKHKYVDWDEGTPVDINEERMSTKKSRAKQLLSRGGGGTGARSRPRGQVSTVFEARQRGSDMQRRAQELGAAFRQVWQNPLQPNTLVKEKEGEEIMTRLAPFLDKELIPSSWSHKRSTQNKKFGVEPPFENGVSWMPTTQRQQYVRNVHLPPLGLTSLAHAITNIMIQNTNNSNHKTPPSDGDDGDDDDRKIESGNVGVWRDARPDRRKSTKGRKRNTTNVRVEWQPKKGRGSLLSSIATSNIPSCFTQDDDDDDDDDGDVEMVDVTVNTVVHAPVPPPVVHEEDEVLNVAKLLHASIDIPLVLPTCDDEAVIRRLTQQFHFEQHGEFMWKRQQQVLQHELCVYRVYLAYTPTMSISNHNITIEATVRVTCLCPPGDIDRLAVLLDGDGGGGGGGSDHQTVMSKEWRMIVNDLSSTSFSWHHSGVYFTLNHDALQDACTRSSSSSSSPYTLPNECSEIVFITHRNAHFECTLVT